MSAPASRQGFLSGLVAIPTVGLPAFAAITHTDADLIALCVEARALMDRLNEPNPDRSEEADAADLDRYDRMLDQVAATTPVTPEGRAAKAWLAISELTSSWTLHESEMDVSYRLVWSALTDLVGVAA